MSNLMQGEWLRFYRNRFNLWITGVFLLIMTISAVWSGISASQFRDKALQPQVRHASNAAEMHDAPRVVENDKTPDTPMSASAGAPAVRLPALGGLALSVRQMDFLSPAIRVSMRSRHTDGRTGDPLFNPVLHELGVLDFALLAALFIPLVAIALTCGLVQEDRERGIWRLVCVQTAEPWKLVSAAITIRFLAVVSVVISASLLAMLIDSGSTATAVTGWLLFMICYTLVWFCLCGVFQLGRLSTGATAVAMLSVWLALTFMIPAILVSQADSAARMPSRLKSILAVRQLQETYGSQRQKFLAEWFESHPEIRSRVDIANLPREKTFLPGGQKLDAAIRPLMQEFEMAKQEQSLFLERWAMLSPPMATVLAADRLAGIDASRYAGYIRSVNEFEDRWREFFMPRIMSGSAWTAEDSTQIPVFVMQENDSDGVFRQLLWMQLVLAMILAGIFLLLRDRLNRV